MAGNFKYFSVVRLVLSLFLTILLFFINNLENIDLHPELEHEIVQINDEVSGFDLHLFKVNTNLFDIRIESLNPGNHLMSWKNKFSEAKLIVNAFYFNDDKSPSGFLSQNGEILSKNIFDPDKSGVVIFEPDFKIIDTETTLIELSTIYEGAQSFPFLIKEGKASVLKDSGLKARRTFVAEDLDGYVYVGVVPAKAITLYELSRALEKLDIQWKYALNLDGGPSTGVYFQDDKSKTLFESLSRIPTVIVID